MKFITTLLFLITGALMINSQSPMASVNGSTALTTNTIHALDDAVISLEVYPNSESWMWMGPNGYMTTGAAVLLSDFSKAKEGLYTATSMIEGDDVVVEFSLIHLEENFADNDTTYYACGSDSVQISSGVSGLLYNWSNGLTTPSIDVDGFSSSSYAVTVSTIFGDTDSANISVVNTQDSLINVSLMPLTCTNILEIDAPAGAQSYTWSNGQVGQTAYVDLFTIGQISVDMISATGCQSTFVYNIDKSQVSLAIENIQVEGFCMGDDLDLVAPSGYESYVWDTGVTGPVKTVMSLHNDESYVDMTDQNGCLTRRYMTVIIVSALTAEASISHATDCSQLGTLNLTLGNVTEDKLPVTATIYGENGFSEELVLNSMTTNVDLSAGTYSSIDIQTLDDCDILLDGFTIDYYIGVEEAINMPELTICNGEVLVLQAAGSYTTAIWSDGSTEGSITITPSESELYYVDLHDALGCAQRFLYQVNVLEVPEAEMTVNPRVGFVLGSVEINLTAFSPDMFPISVTASDATGEETEIDVMFSESITIQLGDGIYTNLTITASNTCSVVLGDFEISAAATYTTVDAGLMEVCVGTMVQLSAPFTAGASYLWNDGTASISNSIFISGSTSLSVESTDSQGNVINYVYAVLTPEPTMASLSVNNRQSNVLGSIDVEIDNPSSDIFPIEVYVTDVVSGVSQSIGVMNTSSINIQLSDNSYDNLYLINAYGCTTLLGGFEISFESTHTSETMTMTELCAGDQLTLNGPENYTSYLWSDGSQTQNLIFSPTNNSTVSVVATDAFGSTLTQLFPIGINEVPMGLFTVNEGQGNTAGSIDVELSSVTSEMFPVMVTAQMGSGVDVQIASMTSSTINIPLTDGSYTHLTLMSDFGCSQNLGAFNIVSGCSPVTNNPVDVSECEGSYLDFDLYMPNATYEWSTGSSSSSINVLVSGSESYSATVTDANGCLFMHSYNVTSTPVYVSPNVFTFNESESGSGTISLILNSTNTDVYPVALWADIDGVSQLLFETSTNFTSSPLANGVYSNVHLITALGCELGLDNFTIQEYVNLTVITEATQIVCSGETFPIAGPSGYESYNWWDGSTGTLKIVTADVTFDYYVDVVDNAGEMTRYVYPYIVFESPEGIFTVSGSELTIDLTSTNPVSVSALLDNQTIVLGEIYNSGMTTFSPAAGSYTQLTLTTASLCETVLGDFVIGGGNASRLSGKVWLDVLSEEGIFESDEPGLEGIIVRAINVEGDIKAQVITDADGSYMMEVENADVFLEFHSTYNLAVTVPNQGGINEIGSDVDGSNGPGTTDIITVDGDVEVNAGFVHGVLSIDWNDISVVSHNKGHLLKWDVSVEYNLSHYEIERSIGSLEGFYTLDEIKLIDNNESKKSYDFIDNQINEDGIYYYRLKQVDLDGVYSYSKVVSIQADVNNRSALSVDLNIYPIPANTNLNIDITNMINSDELMVDVYTLTGSLVKSEAIKLIGGMESQSFNFNISELEAGLYMLNLTIDNQLVSSKVVVE